jgi:hypothetical protein
MKIKLLTILAGPLYAGAPGDVLEVPEDLGDQLVRGRYADAVESPRTEPPHSALAAGVDVDLETAAVPPRGEEAVERHRKKGRRG